MPSEPQSILTVIPSMFWWLSSAAMAVALNLVAAYLKDPIDRYRERNSARKREEGEKRRGQYLRSMDNLKKNQHLQLVQGLHVLTVQGLAVQNYLLGVSMFAVGPFVGEVVVTSGGSGRVAGGTSALFFTLGSLMMLWGLQYQRHSRVAQRMLEKAVNGLDGCPALDPESPRA